MYAIIKTGGKQYKVSKGDNIQIESLNATIDETVDFDKVLMLNNEGQVEVGTPYLKDMVVSAKVVCADKRDKIKVIKFRRRKRYTRSAGHRQAFSEVEITDIKKVSGADDGA